MVLVTLSDFGSIATSESPWALDTHSRPPALRNRRRTFSDRNRRLDAARRRLDPGDRGAKVVRDPDRSKAYVTAEGPWPTSCSNVT